MQRRERDADTPQNLQAHAQNHQRADRTDHVGRDVERIAEPLCAEHKQEIRQPAGQRLAQHVPHEFTVDKLVIRLKRQKERRCADGGKRDERQLQRLERVGQRQGQRDDAEQKREDVLDQKQRRRALDVVDDPPPLGHNAGQRGKVRIQQHKLRDLAGRLRTRCHRDAAIGIF